MIAGASSPPGCVAADGGAAGLLTAPSLPTLLDWKVFIDVRKYKLAILIGSSSSKQMHQEVMYLP